MDKESKKVEQIEKVEQAGLESVDTELSEQHLDGVAGGKTYFESHSNIANAALAPVAKPTGPVS